MDQDFFYCSELSRQVQEKAYGTASTGDVWLLIEYPLAWGPKALQDSLLSPKLKAHLGALLKKIPRSRLLLIKQDRACGTHINFFVVHSRERKPFILNFQISNYEELADIDLTEAILGRTLAGGTVVGGPLFLVCTHGKRDKCCAKFGFHLYKFLRERAGDCVWQSSHVGGDRFAANLICFPHGLFYAHVTEMSGSAIVDAYLDRRMILDQYRGRACYAAHVQAAEYFIRSESGLTGLNELRRLDSQRLDEQSWRVRFLAPLEESVHEVKVSSSLSEFRNFITCQATEEKSVIQYTLADYQVTSARPQQQQPAS
ncbi:MAG TPA: sucrase ferredoxin [Pyrinomonadaceae bacterium]|jgi:hypothetical protein